MPQAVPQRRTGLTPFPGRVIPKFKHKRERTHETRTSGAALRRRWAASPFGTAPARSIGVFSGGHTGSPSAGHRACFQASATAFVCRPFLVRPWPRTTAWEARQPVLSVPKRQGHAPSGGPEARPFLASSAAAIVGAGCHTSPSLCCHLMFSLCVSTSALRLPPLFQGHQSY